MTQIIGRLTSDATVKSLENGNEVVNFTIAINDDYKPKGETHWVEQVTFIHCGYWYKATIASILRKGAIVEAGGRLFPTAYKKDDKFFGQINLQVQQVKVIAYPKKEAQTQEEATPAGDELPFETPDVAQEQAPTNNKKRRKPNTSKDAQAVAAEVVDDLPF